MFGEADPRMMKNILTHFKDIINSHATENQNSIC